MVIMSGGPRQLPKGANVGLGELDAGLGAITVVLATSSSADRPVEADVSVLILYAGDRVRSSEDLVFYNQPIALDGAVHLRDKARLEADRDDEAVSLDVVTLELDDVPDDVERIVVSASLDPGLDVTFGDVARVGMTMQRTADAVDLVAFDVEGAQTETALIVCEFYRRDGDWRVRAVGQGYSGGLEALVVDHGVEVGGEAASTGEIDEEPETTGLAISENVDDAERVDENAGLAPQLAEVERETAAVAKRVSVKRPVRAPKLPADWDKSIPAADGNDWQPARLFPVAGIGRGEEQERRATSALLAVMATVKEFGRAITAKCGAPGGAVTTYVEVPFGQDEEAYRPDGLIHVSRGQKTWTAIVEVKTSDGRLRADQIDHYVDIARSRSFDAVVTISNELTGADGDHPVAIDKRKLRKLKLVHLPWDQIRAEALLLTRHRGVTDATQQHVLEEFVRYMDHTGSGMAGLTDMGPNWVKVRNGIKDRTARSSDKPVIEVSARFDQLIQHIALQLTGILGVNVQPIAPRSAPDNVSRCQQLADSGEMFGCLRIPGAMDDLVINADLRADRVTASMNVAAPRGSTRPSTRVAWLMNQLSSASHDSIRIEANLAGKRGATTTGLLAKVREDPNSLIPQDQAEIRSFTVELALPMGSKRAAGTGTLIQSIKNVTIAFYADVVQHLRAWKP